MFSSYASPHLHRSHPRTNLAVVTPRLSATNRVFRLRQAAALHGKLKIWLARLPRCHAQRLNQAVKPSRARVASVANGAKQSAASEEKVGMRQEALGY
ncbi:hypothetical protein DENSPDRAFT_193616 [Dentipellis sp. KUC8613]|nr:hypothetical protein DENSPDRAFT_193616 [Dentipellis sp. KUC8613]